MNANTKYDKYAKNARYTSNGWYAGKNHSNDDYSGDGISGLFIKAIIMIALVACVIAVIAVF